MPKATLNLPDGTVVTIDGTPEEVHKLLQLYGSNQPAPAKATRGRRKAKTGKAKEKATQQKESVDHAAIINLVKTSDEAEQIEANILDRASVVDRTLLPLYIVHEYLDNAFGLTSGDVNKITTDLGIPVRTPHASTTLSKTAARYVVADRVRKKGVPTRYKLVRRGVQYMKSVITGESDEGQG